MAPRLSALLSAALLFCTAGLSAQTSSSLVTLLSQTYMPDSHPRSSYR